MELYKLILLDGFSERINKNLESSRKYHKNYYKNNKKKCGDNSKRYYQRNRESRLQYAKEYRKNNPEKVKHIVKFSSKRKKLQQKYTVFNHYSKGTMSCKCCNENTYDLLTIDHINNDGKAHRKELKSHYMYRWLIKNNYPKGFQVLCMNCNWGRAQQPDKICPHQKLVKGALF